MKPHHQITPRNHRGLLTYTAQNDAATGEIAAHGAHLLSWQPQNFNNVIWLSEKSEFENDKPIRGGVPICFPWFGLKRDDEKAPLHGLARLSQWRLKSSQDSDVRSELFFVPDVAAQNQPNWPRDCEIEMRFAIGASLEMEFWVQNRGASTCEYEIALHTYFAVSDVRQIEISGLEGVPFWSKADQQDFDGENQSIRINAETDRVYQNTASTCTLRDAGWNREIVIEKSGSNSTVVWNPWREKAAQMPDFEADEWTQMICIETANFAQNRIVLEPNSQHSTVAKISARSL